MAFLQSIYQYLSLISAYKLPSVRVMFFWLSWCLINQSSRTFAAPAPRVPHFPADASGDSASPKGLQPLRLHFCEREGNEEQSGHDRELHAPALYLPARGHRLGAQTPPAD